MAFVDPIIAKKTNELRKRLRSVDVDGQKFYVAEGDLLIEDEKLHEYVPHSADLAKPNVPVGSSGDGLLGIMENGKILRWPEGFVLKYRLLPKGFSSDQRATLRTNLAAATGDWEATCAVTFQDVTDEEDDAVFTVRSHDAGGAFIAAAFFPNSPPAMRQMLIDPSYFSAMGFDMVGVLRHELGHVLGFRHEHIRSGAPPYCPRESLDKTIDLTQYDPSSVMHYFCGQVGSRDLAITPIDIEGAQKVYGPPRSGKRAA
ncbi:Bacterial leucyl aminopeptidase [Minicystis rosea]|nr:Bacterial leucyl aminopeptidase [Minicystis rosea]